jgi:hypothetical protein
MRFANADHNEINAGTTSLGFRLDFHRSYEDQYAPTESIIIGGEVGWIISLFVCLFVYFQLLFSEKYHSIVTFLRACFFIFFFHLVFSLQLGRLLNKENEGVITVINDDLAVANNFNHSGAVVILEHGNNTIGRGFKVSSTQARILIPHSSFFFLFFQTKFHSAHIEAKILGKNVS